MRGREREEEGERQEAAYERMKERERGTMSWRREG